MKNNIIIFLFVDPADPEGSCQELMEVGHLEVVELVPCNHNRKNGAVVSCSELKG